MLRFSRRKTSSKCDEAVCSSNGCVGGRSGEDVWSMGAKTGSDGAPVHTSDEYCIPDVQPQPSTYLTQCGEAQNKTRRTKPLSVLHVIRDKLKPSASKSRSLQGLAECTSPSGHCGPESVQHCCSLTHYVSGLDGDIVKERCSRANCADQCSCNATNTVLPQAEKGASGVAESGRNEQATSTNVVINHSDELLISGSVDRSISKSDSPTDIRCSQAKPHTVHGGLVLSQLSNIVTVESCMKSDLIAAEGTSRLPLSPLSNSDSGLDAPDDRHPAKWTLANELLRLSKYGWYWGPVSREEAEEKLAGQPEGAFLVRDSTDDRYLFSLSFRSSGRTLHTRVEYCNGEFSFYAQPQSDSYRSMAELIEQCVAESQSGIYCYSRGTSGIGSHSYPVKLTRPVSRFAQVRTLQYLCRFVIRQHTRVDHIQNLPLPVSVKGWLKENQY